MNDDNQKYMRAKKKVEELKGFYIHLAVFLIINLGLFLLNKIVSPDSLWFIWPLMGWGLAIIIHAITVFIIGGRIGTDWEERKIREEMEKG